MKDFMKKLYLLLITTLCTQANDIALTISGAQQTQMPITIMILDKTDTQLADVARCIQKDLQFTDQFSPTIAHVTKKNLKNSMQQLCDTGIALALCLSNSARAIEWRLYDTMSCTMLQGKKYKKHALPLRAWAHNITDELYKTLTGNDGYFSSRIAYCKDSKNSKGNTVRKLYVADVDGSNEELLVDLATITVGPRWHPAKAEIYYSEYADTNVELMSVCMDKTRTPVANYEGINMLATFSPDGHAMAYCASHGSGSSQIYLRKDGKLKQCTNNSGNNTSPIFIDNDHLCLCSDVQTGNPQIYIANIQTGHVQRITTGGYCTSPSYCAHNNKIVYHKMIHGTMQLMLYDCATKRHTQLTKTAGNKHEASWSAGGMHLLFAHETNTQTSRLCSLNLVTNKTKYITAAQEKCSYPHWGPCYKTFPVVG